MRTKGKSGERRATGNAAYCCTSSSSASTGVETLVTTIIHSYSGGVTTDLPPHFHCLPRASIVALPFRVLRGAKVLPVP